MCPNLTIIIPSETVRSYSNKKIKEITSGKERLDVIARCLVNVTRAAKRMNYYTRFILYLSHPKEKKALVIPVNDLCISSELDAIIYLITLFKQNNKIIKLKQKNFEDLLLQETKDASLFYLHPMGIHISNLSKLIQPTDSLVFVIGSQTDLTQDQEKLLYKLGSTKISLGNKEYLASHVITLLLYELYHIFY